MLENTFYKYHGCGNDFIVVYENDLKTKLTAEIISKLCNRHYGIGSDGLLVLSDDSEFDFRMKFYNPNGSPATFCGNGARCIVAFANYIGKIGNECNFIADDGAHYAKILNNPLTSDEIKIVKLSINEVLKEKKTENGFLINTGTNHYVEIKDDIENYDLLKYGSKMVHSEIMGKNGANINIVKINYNNIDLRTYENGVYDETLSCGTGAVASALIANKYLNKTAVTVNTKGGKLHVDFSVNNEKYFDIFLTGETCLVFKGMF